MDTWRIHRGIGLDSAMLLDELREVGAVAVYDSVADVRAHLDVGPIGELIRTLA